MLGTGQDGGECCGKAIGEVNPSTLGKNYLIKINGCCCCIKPVHAVFNILLSDAPTAVFYISARYLKLGLRSMGSSSI